MFQNSKNASAKGKYLRRMIGVIYGLSLGVLPFFVTLNLFHLFIYLYSVGLEIPKISQISFMGSLAPSAIGKPFVLDVHFCKLWLTYKIRSAAFFNPSNSQTRF